MFNSWMYFFFFFMNLSYFSFNKSYSNILIMKIQCSYYYMLHNQNLNKTINSAPNSHSTPIIYHIMTKVQNAAEYSHCRYRLLLHTLWFTAIFELKAWSTINFSHHNTYFISLYVKPSYHGLGCKGHTYKLKKYLKWCENYIFF